VENDGGSKAGDLVAVLGEDIGENGVASRRYLTRQVDILGQFQLALVKWALQIHLLNLITQVRFLVDEGDEAVFDLKVDLRAFLDVLGEVAFCGDGEGFASFRRVGIQIHPLNQQQVLTSIRAKRQRVLARHLERVIHGGQQPLILGVTAEPCRPGRRRSDVQQWEDCSELHLERGTVVLLVVCSVVEV